MSWLLQMLDSLRPSSSDVAESVADRWWRRREERRERELDALDARERERERLRRTSGRWRKHRGR